MDHDPDVDKPKAGSARAQVLQCAAASLREARLQLAQMLEEPTDLDPDSLDAELDSAHLTHA